MALGSVKKYSVTLSPRSSWQGKSNMCLERCWLLEDVEEMRWGGNCCTRFLGEGCEREEGDCGGYEKVNRVETEKSRMERKKETKLKSQRT